MDFLKVLILLVTVGGVFGGGDSNCEIIQDDFIVLLQSFESMIQGMLNLANSKFVHLLNFVSKKIN
jgi:hypothetical protein